MEPEAHKWYQLSPFPGSNAAIAMQHHPGNIHQSFATPRYSATPCYVSIQLPNVIDKGGQQGGVKYSIQSFTWKPTTCVKNHKLRNSKKHFKQSPKAAQG